MTSKSRVGDFMNWVDCSAPMWVGFAVIFLSLAAGIAGIIAVILVLTFAYNLNFWFGMFTLGAMIWFGPVRLARYVWARYQADTG